MRLFKFILVFVLCVNIFIYMCIAFSGAINTLPVPEIVITLWGIFTVLALLFLIGWAIWDGMNTDEEDREEEERNSYRNTVL